MTRADAHEVARALRSEYSRRARGPKKTKEDCYAASYQLAVDRGYADPEGIAKAVCELLGHCCESAHQLVRRVLAEGFGNKPSFLKYKTVPDSGKLRIVALRSFLDVKTGTHGGLVSSESNLSQEGTCWIYPWASVLDQAYVGGAVQVRNDAVVKGKARILESAVIGQNAEVFDSAIVRGSAYVGGAARVYDHAVVEGNACIGGSACVGGNSHISGNEIVNNGIHE